MKTVRFATVVHACGSPETYLLLMDPVKDRTLQTAVTAHRVMTFHQNVVGTKTDRGEVGFAAGPARQFFVFPKSLRVFAGRAIVGTKYDLLHSGDMPQRERASPPHPAEKGKPKPPATRREKLKTAGAEKVVAFQPKPAKD